MIRVILYIFIYLALLFSRLHVLYLFSFDGLVHTLLDSISQSAVLSSKPPLGSNHSDVLCQILHETVSVLGISTLKHFSI